MNRISKTLIESLTSDMTPTKLTIYMPAHRYPTPPHIQEDQTRFKNLIREGRDKWERAGDKQVARNVYRELESRLDDLDFWHETTEGLAVFASENQLEICQLPMECEARVTVGDAYDITPLLALHNYNQPFYVLALAAHEPKFFQGDMYGIQEMHMDFPSSPEEALGIDEMFSDSNTVRGDVAAGISPHGEGDSSEAGREERLQYFRIIDDMIVRSREVDSNLPVLLAGTDNDAGDYRQLTKLPKVLNGGLQGNHTPTPPQELYAHAWRVVTREVHDARAGGLAEQFHALTGTGKSSSDIEDIAKAANEGRVATLMLAMFERSADSVSDANNGDEVMLRFPDDYGAAADVAQEVFARGGEVVGFEKSATPEASDAMAIYRY